MSSYFLGKRLIFHRSIPAGIALAGSFVLCLPDAAAQTIATDPPQDGCDRPCPSRHRHRRAKLDESYDGGTTGLRLSTTRVDGSDADTPGGDFGLQLGGSNESYGAKGLLNFRSAGFGFIGGGELGFEGGFGGDAAVGLRGKFSRYQGPFLRLG